MIPKNTPSVHLNFPEAILDEYLKEIEIFRGIIPICSYCKSIRDEDGNWVKVEHFISERSEAKFSHGICTHCLHEHYPNLD